MALSDKHRIIRCLLVDDEPIALKIIRNYLDGFADIEIVKECRNAIQAFEVLQNTKIDLVFLDINMPKLSGIDLLKSISNPPKVIITTAHRQYAPESFDLEVLDYLLKPISYERFLKAINRFYRSVDSEDNRNLASKKSQEADFIYLKEGRKVHKVLLDDILYLESMKEYVQVHLKESNIRLKSRLSDLENRLPVHDFIRIHKSYLISISKIKQFEANTVRINSVQLPISRSYKQEFSRRVSGSGIPLH